MEGEVSVERTARACRSPVPCPRGGGRPLAAPPTAGQIESGSLVQRIEAKIDECRSDPPSLLHQFLVSAGRDLADDGDRSAVDLREDHVQNPAGLMPVLSDLQELMEARDDPDHAA